MRKLYRLISILTMLSISMSLVPSVSAVTKTWYPLYAGQNTFVGHVAVWNDADDLHVQYLLVGDWKLAETHLHVATSLGGIPQTKKGNPIPGKFDYSMVHNPYVAQYTYVIDLDTLGGTDLTIAAHAVVIDSEAPCLGSETAWARRCGAPPQGFPGKNWATYIEYTVNSQ
jgi:hypothetical protein